MSAQVTEAHRELAPLIAYACYGGKFDDDQTDEQQIPERCLVVAAQLIADSEARACAWALWAITCTHHTDKQRAECPVCLITALTSELGKLRAEVERLKADGAASAFVSMACRASHAEADRNNLRADLDAIKAILTEERARAERAEAELKAEQERCDKLLSVLVYADQILDDIDTCSDAHKPMYSTYSQNVFKLCIKGRDARRAVIDSAIKKETT